jgi:hypothetical protein
MPKPHFVFTQLSSSFRVHIPNLEDLEVSNIQKIEAFVKERKGYFDFNSYSFVLQKRLDYEEFQRLIEQSGLDVTLQNSPQQNLSAPRVSFGQYKGLFYTELPDSYLIWLKNNYHGNQRAFLDAELKRRNL